jgi:hypothetical protein
MLSAAQQLDAVGGAMVNQFSSLTILIKGVSLDKCHIANVIFDSRFYTTYMLLSNAM